MRRLRSLVPTTAGLLAPLLLAACSAGGWVKSVGMRVSEIQTIPDEREGRAGPIAWRATDMQVARKVNDDGAFDIYSFTLVLTNTLAAAVTLTRLEWNVDDEGIIRPSPYSQGGPWVIPPHGDRRFSWPYSLSCPRLYTCAPTETVEPTWSFRFTGTTAQGDAVDVPITVSLPPQVLRTRFTD
jgi:hypothetical protein